jgi:putative Mn2+ efflux pump MntP
VNLNWLSLLGISVALGADALAVSIAAGLALKTVTPRHVFRLSFHFGLFQFVMPIVGRLAGRQLTGLLSVYNRWAAFGLLLYVGGKMLWEARREKTGGFDPTRGLPLVTLSLATSLDALAVGLSMALLGVSVWAPSVVFGTVAAGMTAAGILLADRLGPRWEYWGEAIGGIVLILTGLKLVVSG